MPYILTKFFEKKSYQEDFIKGNFYLSSLATFTKTYAERGLIEAAAQGDRYAKGILDRQRNKSQRDVLEGTIASIPPSRAKEFPAEMREVMCTDVMIRACEEDYSVKMTLGFDLKKANTVKDIVETVFIYNAYCDGKGLLMGHPVGRTQDKADDKKFDEKSAQFWEKVLEIEEKLNLKFIPPKDDIEFETICLVEQLYQNLICKKPVKQREIITSIISDMNVKEGVNLDDLIGKQIFFQYNATTTFELFEKEFSLPAILGIFNSTFKSYEILDDNKTKIILGIKDKNQKPFTAILCFASDSDLNEYVKENPDCYENILSNAKFPQDYLE